MLNKIIDTAVSNRLLVVLALIAMLFSTLLILPKLNLDAFPDVTNVQVTINTEASGLAGKRSLIPSIVALVLAPMRFMTMPTTTSPKGCGDPFLSRVVIVTAPWRISAPKVRRRPR